jgi:hypothetical protein
MKSIAHYVRSFLRVCLGIAPLFALTLTAQAHDPGLSTATVRVGDQQIEVLLGFAQQDAAFILLPNANQADIGTPEGIQAMRKELESLTASGFNLYLGEQRVVPTRTTARLKDSRNVITFFSCSD